MQEFLWDFRWFCNCYWIKRKNFYGTGRSVDFLVNTSDDKNQFKLITTDRLSYEYDANISYSINYKQEDFSKLFI